MNGSLGQIEFQWHFTVIPLKLKSVLQPKDNLSLVCCPVNPQLAFPEVMCLR